METIRPASAGGARSYYIVSGFSRTSASGRPNHPLRDELSNRESISK